MVESDVLDIISIHSLVKRETKKRPRVTITQGYFNPLPRKEGDCTDLHYLCIAVNFNPLPRKEGDRRVFPSFIGRWDFNPLPRKEGDGQSLLLARPAIISIHSLVKRETMQLLHDSNFQCYFNPLPRKEGDRFGIPYSTLQR